jgi:imidazolonepropionase-like amidohydrolase
MKKSSLINISLFCYLAFTISALNSMAQVPSPAPPQKESVIIMNGTAHLGNGLVIENSVIAFENGKLTVVADAKTIKLDMSRFSKKIDAYGKHIYPGFIAPNTTLGLTEVGAVRATHDYNDVGENLPNVRSLIAFNTESKIIPTVRSNGVLLTQATPRGGIISGSSSVFYLDGWNWEDAVLKEDDGIHINWPHTFNHSGWWAEPGGVKKNEKAQKQTDEIKTLFKNAKAYSEEKNHSEKNLRFEAMRGLFNGTRNLYIHADFVKDIESAVLFAKDAGVKKTVIVGGYDSWMITDMLRENNISVILRRVHDLPMRAEDDIDMPFKLPYLLHKAGVLYCLNNEGDMEAMNTRNLPFYAGTASTYGLTKEEALMAITSNTAKILGIDGSVGSLETGKDASLVISTGDALDMKTNNVETAFIEGREIDLNNHQKELYLKYQEKYAK